MNQTLLVELLTEELPPKALTKLADSFAGTIEKSLRQDDFLTDASKKTVYATPRRLAVTITDVRDISPDKPIRRKVLPVSVALDAEGKPTAPLKKKTGGHEHRRHRYRHTGSGQRRQKRLLFLQLHRQRPSRWPARSRKRSKKPHTTCPFRK